jgi:uncharacterized protein YjbI with pentapeptide repeats
MEYLNETLTNFNDKINEHNKYVRLYNDSIFNANLHRTKFDTQCLALCRNNFVKFNNKNILGNFTFDHLDLSFISFDGCSFVDLTFVNCTFEKAIFQDCDMKNVHFYDCDLDMCSFIGCVRLNIPSIVPDSGSFIGWKQASDSKNNVVIIKLLIPSDAKRSNSNGRKCRANKAYVLEIQNLDGTKSNETTAYSIFRHSFKYRIGELVEVSDFDENRFVECSTGIHFFITRDEAAKY